MLVLGIIGVLSLFFGIILLFFPQYLTKLSDFFNKALIAVDENLLRMRIGLGISLIAIGIVCFFLIYYYFKI